MESIFEVLKISNNIQNTKELLSKFIPKKRPILALPNLTSSNVEEKKKTIEEDLDSLNNVITFASKHSNDSIDVYQDTLRFVTNYIYDKLAKQDGLDLIKFSDTFEICKINVAAAIKKAMKARVNALLVASTLHSIEDIELTKEGATIIYNPKKIDGMSEIYFTHDYMANSIKDHLKISDTAVEKEDYYLNNNEFKIQYAEYKN